MICVSRMCIDFLPSHKAVLQQIYPRRLIYFTSNYIKRSEICPNFRETLHFNYSNSWFANHFPLFSPIFLRGHSKRTNNGDIGGGGNGVCKNCHFCGDVLFEWSHTLAMHVNMLTGCIAHKTYSVYLTFLPYDANLKISLPWYKDSKLLRNYSLNFMQYNSVSAAKSKIFFTCPVNFPDLFYLSDGFTRLLFLIFLPARLIICRYSLYRKILQRSTNFASQFVRLNQSNEWCQSLYTQIDVRLLKKVLIFFLAENVC